MVAIANVATPVHRIDSEAAFGLYVPSTFVEPQMHWLTVSAREFGFEIS